MSVRPHLLLSNHSFNRSGIRWNGIRGDWRLVGKPAGSKIRVRSLKDNQIGSTLPIDVIQVSLLNETVMARAGLPYGRSTSEVLGFLINCPQKSRVVSRADQSSIAWQSMLLDVARQSAPSKLQNADLALADLAWRRTENRRG